MTNKTVNWDKFRIFYTHWDTPIPRTLAIRLFREMVEPVDREVVVLVGYSVADQAGAVLRGIHGSTLWKT